MLLLQYFKALQFIMKTLIKESGTWKEKAYATKKSLEINFCLNIINFLHLN